MPRPKTGRAPTASEWRVTYLHDGVERVVIHGRRRAEHLGIPPEATITATETTKWQTAYWKDGRLVYATAKTKDEAAFIFKTKGRRESATGGQCALDEAAERSPNVLSWSFSRYVRWLLADSLKSGAIQQSTYFAWFDLLRNQIESDEDHGGAELAATVMKDITVWNVKQFIERKSEMARASCTGGRSVHKIRDLIKHVWTIATNDPDLMGHIHPITFKGRTNPFAVTADPELVRPRREAPLDQRRSPETH